MKYSIRNLTTTDPEWIIVMTEGATSTMVRFTLISFLIFISTTAFAAKDLLFEGYVKVLSEDQHVGFVIVKYEFDGKEKKFYSTYLNKISTQGLEVIESLQAVAEADDKMSPISYKYNSVVGKSTKTVEAKFTKGKNSKEKTKMVATVNESGKKTVTIRNDLAPDVFLSTFLTYRMLRSELGIQTNSKFRYTAVAEEDVAIKEGTAETEGRERFKGFDSFKIKNTFGDALFISHVTEKGEPLMTQSPSARITTELVPTPGEAIGSIGLPESIAKTVFGNIPSGAKNTVAEFFKNADKLKPPTNGGKQEGFPAGQGVQIKNSNPKSQEGP